MDDIKERILKQREGKYALMQEDIYARREQYGNMDYRKSVFKIVPQIYFEIEELTKPDIVKIFYGISKKDVSKVEQEEITPEWQEELDKKEKEIKKVVTSKKAKYDKEGTFVVKVGNEEIVISATPRQLAEAGILYSDMDWKEQSKVVGKEEWAIADKKMGLTTSEVKEAQNIFQKIIAKIKDAFNRDEVER